MTDDIEQYAGTVRGWLPSTDHLDAPEVSPEYAEGIREAHTALDKLIALTKEAEAGREYWEKLWERAGISVLDLQTTELELELEAKIKELETALREIRKVADEVQEAGDNEVSIDPWWLRGYVDTVLSINLTREEAIDRYIKE